MSPVDQLKVLFIYIITTAVWEELTMFVAELRSVHRLSVQGCTSRHQQQQLQAAATTKEEVKSIARATFMGVTE